MTDDSPSVGSPNVPTHMNREAVQAVQRRYGYPPPVTGWSDGVTPEVGDLVQFYDPVPNPRYEVIGIHADGRLTIERVDADGGGALHIVDPERLACLGPGVPADARDWVDCLKR